MNFKPGDKVIIAADDHLGFPQQRATIIEHYELELWTVQVCEADRDASVNDVNGIAVVADFDLTAGWPE